MFMSWVSLVVGYAVLDTFSDYNQYACTSLVRVSVIQPICVVFPLQLLARSGFACTPGAALAHRLN
jgi:hypothetical protein